MQSFCLFNKKLGVNRSVKVLLRLSRRDYVETRRARVTLCLTGVQISPRWRLDSFDPSLNPSYGFAKIGSGPKNHSWIPLIALSDLCHWAVQHTRKPHPWWHHGIMTSLSHSPPNIGVPITICYPQTGGTVQTTRCVSAVLGCKALTAHTQISRDTGN